MDFNHAGAWLQASMWIKCISGVFTAASALSVLWGAKCAKITFLMLSLLFKKYLSLLLYTVSLSSYRMSDLVNRRFPFSKSDV